MKNYSHFIISFALAVLAILIPERVQADQRPAQWPVMIEEIQKETAYLMDEYTRLDTENQQLNMELELTAARGGSNRKEPEAPASTEAAFTPAEEGLKFKDINHLKETIAAVEKHNRSLEKEWLVLDEKERLRQLQINDLLYQERTLRLENKLQMTIKSSADETGVAPDDSEINELRRQLSELQAQEESLREDLPLEISDENAPVDVVTLEDEVSRLRAELSEMKSKKDLQIKKLNSLKKEVKEKVSSPYVKKFKTREALDRQVKTLEVQINELDKQVDYINGLHGRKRKLIDEIMALEKKNRELLSRMSELSQNAEVLKTEIGLLESQLPAPLEQSEDQD